MGQGLSVGLPAPPPRPPLTPDKQPFFGGAGRRSRLFARLVEPAVSQTPNAPRGAAAGRGTACVAAVCENGGACMSGNCVSMGASGVNGGFM